MKRKKTIYRPPLVTVTPEQIMLVRGQKIEDCTEMDLKYIEFDCECYEQILSTLARLGLKKKYGRITAKKIRKIITTKN